MLRLTKNKSLLGVLGLDAKRKSTADDGSPTQTPRAATKAHLSQLAQGQSLAQRITNLASRCNDAKNQDELQKIISELIESLGIILGAQRGFYFQFSPQQETASMLLEWSSKETQPLKKWFQCITLEKCPWWKSMMMDHFHVELSALSDLFPNQDVPNPTKMVSILCLPVAASQDNLYGFLAFEVQREPYTWPEEQLCMLKLLAATIGNTIERLKQANSSQQGNWLPSKIIDTSISGYWDWNLVQNTQYLSQGFKRMLGYTDIRDSAKLPETWQATIFPDDLNAILATLDQHIKKQIKEPFYQEVRYRHQNGSTVWAICTGNIISWTTDGVPLRIVGCNIDITKRVLAQAELRSDELRLMDAEEVGNLGSWDYNFTTQKVTWSPQTYKIYGEDPNTFAVNFDSVIEHYPAEELDSVLQAMEQALAQKKDVFIDHRIITPDGTERYVHQKGRIVFDQDGTPIHMIGSIIDITERKKNELKLQEANQKLSAAVEESRKLAAMAESANLTKKEFLARMSHEIRTPLNGVMGMLSLILASNQTEKHKKYAKVAQNSANSLLSIVNDILDFSKLDAGKLKIEKIDFNLIALVKAVLAPLETQANVKNVSLTYEIAPDIPDYVKGDPLRLRQILTNLTYNALKFTDTGEVKIRISHEEHDQGINMLGHHHEKVLLPEATQSLRFSVTDTGIGIPTDKIDKLFRTFSQVDSSTTRKYGGTGLGLVIAKELVTLMGGTIGVNSEKDRGSEFWFTAVLEKSDRRTTTKTEPDLAAFKGRFARRKIKMLVAEDDITNQNVIEGILEMLGIKADLASNGREAVAAAQSNTYDLILMDIQMPEMDGVEATQIIKNIPQELPEHAFESYSDSSQQTATISCQKRSDQKMCSPPVIALTAHVIPEDRDMFLKSGMDDFLAKPINAAALVRVLDKWL